MLGRGARLYASRILKDWSRKSALNVCRYLGLRFRGCFHRPGRRWLGRLWKERPFASKAELTDWLWGSSDAGRVVMSSRRHSPRRGVGQTPRVHTAGLSEESELGAPDVGTGTDVNATPEEKGTGVAGGGGSAAQTAQGAQGVERDASLEKPGTGKPSTMSGGQKAAGASEAGDSPETLETLETLETPGVPETDD